MTFNGSWGYMPYAPDEDWHSTRQVVKMLNQVTHGGGNLLLNIGPKPDGSVPELAYERLEPVGKWLDIYGEAVYGTVDALDRTQLHWMPMGNWSRKGKTAYYWVQRWPGSEVRIGNLLTKVNKITLLSTGKEVPFEQDEKRLIIKDLPENNPDAIAGISVLKLECQEPLRGHNEANRRWVKKQ
jgi:alpha-L-fucosidase